MARNDDNISAVCQEKSLATVTGHAILDERTSDRLDINGDPIIELLVAGIGWCDYSRKLAAVAISGKWHTIGGGR